MRCLLFDIGHLGWWLRPAEAYSAKGLRPRAILAVAGKLPSTCARDSRRGGGLGRAPPLAMGGWCDGSCRPSKRAARARCALCVSP